MAEIIEIENVPKDVDPTEVGTVKNPLDVEFSCVYNRTKRITIKPGEKKVLPLNIAIHAAKHLADRIIWLEREEEIARICTKKVQGEDGKVTEVVDEKLKFQEEKRPIANYQAKLWEKMKEVVKTDSKFFKDPDARRKATGNSEIASDVPEEEMQEM